MSPRGRARHRLDADDEDTDRHDERLDDAEEAEQHPPAHVLGRRRRRADPLFIHVELKKEDERERADPQREIVNRGAIADP